MRDNTDANSAITVVVESFDNEFSLFDLCVDLKHIDSTEVWLTVSITSPLTQFSATHFFSVSSLVTFHNSLAAMRQQGAGDASLRSYEHSINITVIATESLWPRCGISVNMAICGVLPDMNNAPRVDHDVDGVHRQVTHRQLDARVADPSVLFSVNNGTIDDIHFNRLTSIIADIRDCV